jgi:short-subunit dehydrogenase
MVDIMNQKTYLIIGATGGIGKALSYKLKSKGHNVILVAKSKERLAILSEALNCPAFSMDITDELDVADKINEIFDAFQEVNGVIHAAGAFSCYNFCDAGDEEKRRVYEINVKGPYLVSEKVFLKWKEKKYSKSMIFVSSIAGLGGVEGKREVYGHSKKMLIELFKKYYVEFNDVAAISCVCPGPTKTPMWEEVYNNLASYEGISPEEVIKRYEQEGHYVAEADITAEHILEVLGEFGCLYVPTKNLKIKVESALDQSIITNFIKSLSS